MKQTRRRRHIAIFFLLSGTAACPAPSSAATPSSEVVELGRALFDEPGLSRDGTTSCHSCHDPTHAYASTDAQPIGVDGRRGIRNAPSLLDVAERPLLFWDGRRSVLDAAVLDPLLHPVEMGWSNASDLTEHLRGRPEILRRFETAFPDTQIWATSDQISAALVAFLRTLKTGSSEFDRARESHALLPPEAEYGKRLFSGVAQCSQCHTLDEDHSSLTDDQFHHSNIGNVTQAETLPGLVATVARTHQDQSQWRYKILTDSQWSSLGRFVVSLRPADIGAFRTPSLRNVAVTTPYMHDGSIATLSEAVDHEIYYRGFSNGRPVNLSGAERRALVAFLETLTDADYATSGLPERSPYPHSSHTTTQGSTATGP